MYRLIYLLFVSLSTCTHLHVCLCLFVIMFVYSNLLCLFISVPPPLIISQEHQIKDALLKRRGAFEQLVGGILHRKQGWFHGAISREESEQRMRRFGLQDGLFLVRERTQVNSFALCVVFNQQVYHYLLDMNSLGQLSIENGRKFENLLQVVDHYSRTPDGLLCCLGDFCPISIFDNAQNGVMQQRVRHGPMRIDDTELEILGDLGMCTCTCCKCKCTCTGVGTLYHIFCVFLMELNLFLFKGNQTSHVFFFLSILVYCLLIHVSGMAVVMFVCTLCVYHCCSHGAAYIDW